MRLSLRTRLTAVLLLSFLVIGGMLFWGILRGSRLYFEEVHYKLNRDVATHVAASLQPFSRGAQGDPVDREVLGALFMKVMHINPSLEVYLLDPSGEILAFDAPPGHVKLDRVDMEPIREALEHPDSEGIPRGTDPRNPELAKPFSVAELREDGRLGGYLYVVLGGEAHERIATALGESALLRGSLVYLLGSLLLAAGIGTLGIALLVRPLRRLRDAMNAFEEGQRPPNLVAGSPGEVGELAAAFESMAGRIASQLQELHENDRRRREFVANVSHDLRTPTAAIQGYLETLMLRWKRLEGEERERFLASAFRQAERLGKLVDELFELTRLEAHEFRPQRESFSLAELVQDITAKFHLPAEQKGIRLRAEIDYDIPPVLGDIALLERALDNLIDNAIRYTRPGGDVRVSLRQVAGGVGVSISDSGPGIPGPALPRLFDRFYRVERGAREDAGGTGLGLAITKRIVDLHEGSIQVRSDPAEGTTFSFVLATSAPAAG
ncbi:MAG TPA: HAMP domain-containing protein [Planctomycetes bacterium]|nr:HAMP domain-containing protein [Planctomycetota bacterium]